MKKFGNKGITLVALVVTIIVLIILAGVSISLVLGQDGVVQKAKEGRDSYAEAARVENEQLANVDAFAKDIESMTPISGTETITGSITDMTNGDLEISATVNLEGNIDFTKTKYVFTTSNSPLGTDDESLYKDGTVEQANSTVKATKKAGIYYLHVLEISKNGTKEEIISDTTATSQGKKNFDYTGDIKNIILTPGNYKLEAWGAQGGGSYGGRGAYSTSYCEFSTQTEIKILVGQQGSKNNSGINNNRPYGGGGGTFFSDSLNKPLCVAGGGGGCDNSSAPLSHAYGSTLQSNPDSSRYPNLTAGNGGSTCDGSCNTPFGGAGGGFYSDGTNRSNTNSAGNGKGFVNGGASGGGGGGFGGGGGGDYEPGGGGGYTGGYGGCGNGGGNNCCGHGGTSFNIGTGGKSTAGNQQFTAPNGSNETGHSGNGYARITALD